MKLTAITCTADRPEAFALCRRYMARQTRQPDQWLVMDQDIPMREKIIMALEQGMIEGDALAFVEDDDYYAPTWLQWCTALLDRFDIVGQGNALYYHVGRRWWSECRNVRHASLCNTAIRRELFEPLLNVCRAYDNPFFDTRLWRIECNRHLHLPKDGERLVIGIKGMPGRIGYSPEHKNIIPPDVTLDPSLIKLWQTIGSDALAYAPFFQR